MKNELLYQSTAYVFSNPALTKQAEIIRKTSNQVIEGAMKIGKAFKEINDKKLWSPDFKSFELFADSVGYSKSTAYNLIKSYEVASRYELKDYTAGQCLEIRTLEIKEGEKGVESALKSGMIAPTMTTKEIREAIKNHLKPESDKSLDDETETEEKAEEKSETKTESVNEYVSILNIEKLEQENRVLYRINGKAVAVSKVPAILEYLEKINEIMEA